MVSGTLPGRSGDANPASQDARGRSSRKRALEPHERQQRKAAKPPRSAAPVACQPLDGHRLDLSGARSVLFVGDALSAKRAAVYEGLLASGTLPIVPHRDSDGTSSYLQRSLALLEKKYADAPFSVTIAGVSAAADGPPRRANQGDLVSVAVMVDGGCVWIDAAEFDAELRRVDPVLAASIFDHLGRATRWTYDAFTPGAAISGAEWVMFNGDVRDWWDELRYTMLEDREAAEALSPREIRKYVRENQLRTPGFVTRSIGSHHARLRGARTTAIPREECSEKLNGLSAAARTLAVRVLDAIDGLERIARALEGDMTAEDRSLLEDDEVPMAQPGLVIETSSSHMVHEVLEELWQYAAQSEGFGLNYAFVMGAEEAAYGRFEQSLALFHEASTIVDGIAGAFTEFSERHERGSKP